MKKIVFTISFLIFISNIIIAQSVLLSGKISNAPDKTKLYLFESFGVSYFKVDSATVTKGEFKFSSSKPLPRGFYAVGIDAQSGFSLILANEKVQVDVDFTKMKESLVISNSVENDFLRKMVKFNGQLQSVEAESKELAPLKEKDPDLFAKKLGEIQKKYDSLVTANNTMKNSVMTSSPNLFFSKVLKMFVINDQQDKDAYFSPEELKDEEYTRGDMMLNKLAYYLQKNAGQDEALWAAEGNDLAKRCLEKSRNRELVYISTILIMAQGGMKIPSSTLKSLKAEFGNSKRTKEFISQLPKGEPTEGDEAPEIQLLDVNGKKLALSSLKGKYVLLDFWASWCGPCRMENPNVVRVYNQYKDKGFTIYSVSLDNSKDNWLAAIQKDGLAWTNHVSDLKGWASEGAALYGVRGIPATFLIDKNGIIIGKNLRGYALEQKLSELIR